MITDPLSAIAAMVLAAAGLVAVLCQWLTPAAAIVAYWAANAVRPEAGLVGWLPIYGVDETSTITFAPSDKTAAQSKAVLEIGPGIHDQ